MGVSRLEKVPIRNVWRNEEKDFTPWLKENIDLLSEILEIDLLLNERRKWVNDLKWIYLRRNLMEIM